MAGRPKTRARKAEEAARAAAAGEQPATKPKRKSAKAKTGGSRTTARTGARASTGTKRKPKPPARSPFEPANDDDFAAATADLLKAATKEASPLTAGERVARDLAVISARALGMTPMTIGEQFGLTADDVARILDSHRTRRARFPIPGSHELLADALEELEAQMERVSLVASRQGASESAMVGAIRTWRDLWLNRLELLQLMNHISTSPAMEGRERRARDLLHRLLDELRAEGVPQAQIDKAAARVLVPGADDAGKVVTLEGRASSG